jgi:UDPglucose 6-dehydrogenase
MNITMVGTGYQGLVVATCLAENGHQITCVDRKADRIAQLQRGELPIHEPGLEELVARNLEEERLTFTTDMKSAVQASLTVFLCVGMRDSAQRGLEACKGIAQAMDGYRIIVNKGACPPGTAEDMEAVFRENSSHPFDLVVNPDFLKEGNAIDDFMRPDRMVIGCDDVRVREIMRELYSPFLRTGKPFLFMDKRSAEMSKLATNVMLAARISMMNQLADLCEAYGADIGCVREGLASDERIGSTFLFPGLGFGGSGLNKDLRTCIQMAKKKSVSCDLLDAVDNVNVRRRQLFLQRILDHYGADIVGKRLAMWGASFKPRTDDLREAPSLEIIEGLRKAGAEVAIYDPVATPSLRERFGEEITLHTRYYQALEDADGLIIVTEWNEFRRPNYERMASLMREKVIFDGRNLYTPEVIHEQGFRYFSIGRPPV